MTLTAGTRLGPYEIVAPLGAGGMGEVYRAKDTRLGREVAVKVLPQHLSDSAEIRARFEREAKTISALNHPNICTLFDVGREGDVDYLVMELVDGETLAQRIARSGALPPADVLKIGAQIADALDRAHRAGVVHRDLKPGNIMLTKAGAKLMDFGLARATETNGPVSASGVTMAALTRTAPHASPLTAEGTLVGTFQYMAPEQLEGGEADARADLWALGCVLYEMATGKRAFDGRSQASLIGAIMTREPAPVSQVAPLAPAGLDRLVRTCLTKDPDERARTAHDLKLQLQGLAESGSQSVGSAAPVALPPRRATRAAWLPWAIAAVCALAAVAGFALHRGGGAPRTVFATIDPPAGAEFSSASTTPMPLAISPDGTRIAFCARRGEGPDMLWVRDLASPTPRPLEGTEGAEQPFFSPDGSALGFFSAGKLRRVGVAGGPVMVLADASDPRGGSWGDGVIVFAPRYMDALSRVSPDGGPVTQATVLDSTAGESTHRHPHFLPDGKHFLYLARSSSAGAGAAPAIYATAIGSAKRTAVARVASNVAYAGGHILYVQAGTLMAQPFDAGRMRTTGPVVPLAEHTQWDERFSRGVFAASRTGVLAFRSGAVSTFTQLNWRDRTGKRLANVGELTDFTYGGTPMLSPDGTRTLMTVLDPDRGDSDACVIDLASGQRRKLTLDGHDHSYAVWMPDGRSYAYNAPGDSGATSAIVVQQLDAAAGRTIVQGVKSGLYPCASSPDGRYVLYSAAHLATANDLFAVPVTGGPPIVVAGGPLDQFSGQFSPDGRFVAYASSESGTRQVYVVPFPPTGAKWQVSQDGGVEARWGRDGRQLYFVDRDNWIVSVAVNVAGGVFTAGAMQRLFQIHSCGGDWRYDVTADGQRFLVTSPPADVDGVRLTLVTNWTATLRTP